MKLTKRERVLIYFAIVLGFLALYYQYYLAPKILEMQNLSVELKSKKQILEQVAALNNKSLKEGLEKQQTQLKELSMILPEERDIEIFLFNLQQMVNDTGVKTKSLAFGNPDQPQDETNNRKKEDFVTIPVNITVSGNYDEIIAFLKEIQNSKRLCNIQSFYIEKDTNQKNLLLTLQVFIYSMKDSGGASIPIDFSKGKNDPFKPLYDNTTSEQSNNVGQPSNPQIPQNLQNIDINKIITDTVEKVLKEKIPSLP
ncbi:type 4a pilus biogenesis protein PilO [Thermoanaerobacter sp. CM-CNRG TB177]|uniref:Type IV pilus assembly protein PilO n=1 Tax=Thermoanaerobacter pentosaceus TaxID=694059 RepID=A0ABT9M0P4_9THEO|nr:MULTISPECIES: type 4a pilus biogenesis protein PilO [Thermoanaerobacter]MBT1279809.1 type 4a pilus biogenesis protein PilO [Thermoanaerobacter sp. CM-CNRG TB177]MDP9749660.1 type IV pilus assembly protein PilO [Thermoanaerobacter pentosaceus]